MRGSSPRMTGCIHAHNRKDHGGNSRFHRRCVARRRAAACEHQSHRRQPQRAMLGYLAGALQGGNLGQSIGHGLAGWLMGERLDRQRLAPAQTYRALADAGVPDAMAKAAPLNPQIMKAVAPPYFGPEPFKDMASVNNVIGRLGDLMTAAGNSAGVAPASASSDPQTPALEDFARARAAVAEDMAHVLRSGGMSEDDIRAWKDALDSSSSADELKAAVGRG